MESDLLTLQSSIKSTEAEIKAIQSQLLRSRAARPPPSSSHSRTFGFPGLPPEHLELLGNLKHSITAKQRKKADLDGRIAAAQEEVDAQRSEIGSLEGQISELQLKVSELTDQKVQIRSAHASAARTLSDRRTEMKSMKRVRRDAETTISAVAARKEIPILDRLDLRPLRAQVARLESDIRHTNDHISELQELIRLEETELGVPIRDSEAESEALASLEDPESAAVEFDVLAMRQQLRAKRRELLGIQNAVTETHIRTALSASKAEPRTPESARGLAQRPVWCSSSALPPPWGRSAPP
jgi:chromosome segregation ATPase